MRRGIALAVVVACSGTSKAPAPATTGGGGTAGSGSAAPIQSPYPTTPTGPAVAPVAAAPGVRVTLADVGLEQGSLDRTVDPCVDFYQFTCGGWLANTPIPPDRARWSRLAEIDERNTQALLSVLEEAATGADATTKKLGDYYASCMDEATIDRSGLAAWKPLLAKVRVANAKRWLPALGELHRHGIWVVFRAQTAPDVKDATTHALTLDAAGLGLPRMAYVDAKHKPMLDGYRTHVAKMLGLAGVPKADAGAADVVAIETELARLHDDVATTTVDVKALAKQTKVIDWKAYWKLHGVEPGKKLVVRAPALFAAVDRVHERFKPAQWSNYFAYHAIDHAALALGKPFTDQAFALATLTRGSEKPPERSRRCLDATAAALGELLGQQYVAKHFPAHAKQTATQIVDALSRALGDELLRIDWLGDTSKQTALAKLAKLRRQLGYPDRFRSYDFDVKREDFAGNLLRASAFATKRELSRWGRPVDRSEWETDVFSIAAAYDPRTNTAVLPAGVLHAPLFGQDRSIAANLGGIGVVFGRELTKGFDAHGSQWDADGNLVSSWTKDDLARFAERAKCVEAQYNAFEAMPKQFVDGKRTLGENIADMAGVKLAFKAYRALRKDAAKVYVADGYTEDQQFFIAVGQAACTRDRPAELAKRLQSDPFAPPKFRVYGSLRNMREFAEAFSCAAGTPMNPAKTCSVW